MNEPRPATVGLKEFPETPVPLQTPPVGFAVSVPAASFQQYSCDEAEITKTGNAFTVTVVVAVFVQPAELVPVNV